MPRRDPGTICIVRDVRFVVANSGANNKRAQKLLEWFGMLWLNEFPDYAQPYVHATAQQLKPRGAAIEGDK